MVQIQLLHLSVKGAAPKASFSCPATGLSLLKHCIWNTARSFFLMGTRRIPTLRILLHFPRKTEGHFFLPSDTLIDVINGQLWLSHPMITCNPSNCAYYPHLCHFSEMSSYYLTLKTTEFLFPVKHTGQHCLHHAWTLMGKDPGMYSASVAL